MERVRKYLPLAIVAPLGLALDQLSKYLAVAHLTTAFTRLQPVPFYTAQHLLIWKTAPVTLSSTFWDFHYAENTGAAFSFLATANDSVRIPFFYAVAVAATILISYFYVRSTPSQLQRRFALAMVLGGALGNTLDRVVHGYVIDFIHWHAGSYDWPVFNVADSFVCVGVALLLLEGSFSKKAAPAAAPVTTTTSET